MQNTSPETIIEGLLAELFPNLEIRLQLLNYVGKVSAFFVKFPTIEELSADWEPLSNAIAFYYQAKLSDDFDVWNLYVFYVVPLEPDKTVKYKIENDTVSSRKIVVCCEGNMDDEFMSGIVTEHVTNENLLLLPLASLARSGQEKFIKNEIIWTSIKENNLFKGTKIIDERVENTIKNIEQKLRNEIQKG